MKCEHKLKYHVTDAVFQINFFYDNEVGLEERQSIVRMDFKTKAV